ncbi:MAG: DUF262 domain-containing protein [Chloroflexota bacterium]
MEARSLKISKVFSTGGDVHYMLPHFQREYAWDKTNWKTLIDDVFSVYEAYSSDNEPEHFMGALVVINDGTRNGTVPAFKLVDGQQRLITISVILCALGHLIKESHPSLYKKVRRLLTNPDEEGLLYFKLLPTTKYGDRTAYIAIIEGEGDDSPDSRIPQAYEYLGKELEYRLTQGLLDPEKFFIVLTNCMQVVFIDLEQKERPYEIFESLNAKGKPLSQADLVRNYIAMRLPEAQQEMVFEKYWSEIEILLQEKRTVGRSRLGELTAFLRHYLALRMGVLCNEEHVYARFRDRIEKDFRTPEAFIGEISTLKRFAEYYDRFLRPDDEPNASIEIALQRLNILEISTAYPFLLAMYEALQQGQLRLSEFLDGLNVLENYIVRRYLAGEQTNYLNKMFPTLWADIDTTKFETSLRQKLLTKNYPSDARLRKTVLVEPLYDRRSQTRDKMYLILESINRFLSAGSGGHTVLDASPTIEHIMPQSLDREWQHDLGENAEQVWQDYLHTLGNLTLVTQEWNSVLSNASFAIKKQKLASHALRLNSAYFAADCLVWDEEAIRMRAEWLLDNILKIWSSLGEPPVSQSAVENKPKSLLVLGERHDVKSWRDVAFQTAECIVKLVDNFDNLAEQLPSSFIRDNSRRRSRELSNGWWINLDLTGDKAKSLCRNLISMAGLSEEDWQIDFD